jgi:hypothetical protein
MTGFDTKIGVVLRDDLPTWQKLNAAAFLVSGIAATAPESVGAPYEDARDRSYRPMFVQPVLIFAAPMAQLRLVLERATSRGVTVSIFVDELFSTGHDAANRAAFKLADADDFSLVGLAFRTDRNVADKITKGLHLHE